MSHRLFSEPITKLKSRTGPRRKWPRRALYVIAAAVLCWLLSGCHTVGEPSAGVALACLTLISAGSGGAFVWVLMRSRQQEPQSNVDAFIESLTPPSRDDEWRVLNWLAQQPVGEWQRFPAIADGASIQREHLMGVLKRMRWNRILEVTTDGPLKKYRLIDGAWPRGEELNAVTVTTADKREIYGSLVVNLCEARDMVRKSTTDCGSEDYGDRLAGAERKLTQAISAVGGLLENSQRERSQA